MRGPSSAIRRLLREDCGAALAMVLLLGFALILLTSVVGLRSMAQSGSVATDAAWEHTLAVAESGLDDGLHRISGDGGFTTGELPPSFSDAFAERAWVVTAADARPSGEVERVPGGEYVVIRPVQTAAVYAVGYVPARGAADRRVRVVRAQLGTGTVPGSWVARYAILSGGSLSFSGNPSISSGVAVALHTNGHLTMSGNTFMEECVSASDGFTRSGNLTQPGNCATPGSQAYVTLPLVDVRSFWSMSQFDMCPDGRVRAGPAHPVQGNTTTGSPCTGAVLSTSAGSTPFQGWKYLGCCDSKLGAKWEYQGDTPYDGVYFFEEGSAAVPSRPGSATSPWKATLLVAEGGSCPDTVGGDLVISGSPTMRPHPSAGNLLLGVGRDLEISGNPVLSGIVAAQEQVKASGNSQIREGALIINGVCDSVNDNIHVTEWSGNTSIVNTGPVASPFRSSIEVPVVIGWAEL